jgi:PAS domain S-box-containing protein
MWEKSAADIEAAKALPTGATDDRLDPFHDHIDGTASILADLHSLNGNQVAVEIWSLRRREQVQLLAGLAALVIGSTVALFLAGRVGRSITQPLLSLQDAATRFGSDDLSHRIPVSGDDELAQLGNAFNAMASSLHTSRADLRESEQRFRALVHHASDVFTVIGADAVLRYQSPAIEQVLGYPTRDTIGRSFLDVVELDDQDIARQLFERSQMRPGVPTMGEVHMRPLGHQQAPRRFEKTATDLLDDPTVRGLLLNYRDVTERALYEERLTQQAFHDALTSLPNRALFQDRLEHALRQRGQTVGLLFVDLDHFKVVNDRLGRDAGDQLLCDVALSSLSQLPLGILKIDQSFVARVDQDAEGRAIVYAIISLATALGVRVTGEGIETASQLATLIELDCNHGQGFLLGKPAPPDELAARLRTVNTTEVTVAARLARLQ